MLTHLQKRLDSLLNEEKIDMKGTKVKVVLPISIKDILNSKKRKLRNVFRDIEGKVREKADPFYDPKVEFKEVGGYFLIKQIGYEYFSESLYKTEGEVGRKLVVPGRGLDIRWSCNFPEINALDIEWKSAIAFVRYHSHPFTNQPHPQDIVAGIKDLSNIPKNIEYFQAIYSKIWSPNFLWLAHY